MNSEKMFEVAVRTKMRFQFKGLLSAEDLWDLSVEDLDKVFKGLNAQVKQVQEESLLGAKTAEDRELELKINIVKYIVATKLEEMEMRAKARDIKEQEQKIMRILETKREESLENKSEEELLAMLEGLKK